MLRVRAALAVSSQGVALLNGSDADGCSPRGSAGTGEIGSTSEGGDTEAEASRGRASRTAVKMAAEAATAAEQAVARLWEIEMDQELEVSAQQACQTAQVVGLEELKELEKGWLTTVGRPSNREVQ